MPLNFSAMVILSKEQCPTLNELDHGASELARPVGTESCGSGGAETLRGFTFPRQQAPKLLPNPTPRRGDPLNPLGTGSSRNQDGNPPPQRLARTDHHLRRLETNPKFYFKRVHRPRGMGMRYITTPTSPRWLSVTTAPSPKAWQWPVGTGGTDLPPPPATLAERK